MLNIGFKSFKEFMEEARPVNRWFILRVALIGAFVGAILGIWVALSGLL